MKLLRIRVDEVVRTINLSRHFGKIIALDDVNITIRRNEIFGLLGPNGSGKSTLIKILATLLLPTSGEAYVLGYDVKKDYIEIRKHINIVAGDDRPGYGSVKVKENLWFFSQLYGYGRKEGWKIVNQLIEEFGMQEYADRKLNRISSGMFQKYNFVRGILNNPRLLFLDEPTVGLDVEISREIRNYIKSWIKKDPERTILLTTHYMIEAQELCDRVAIIYKGKIVKVDTVENLLKLISNEHVFEIKTNFLEDQCLQEIKKVPGVKGFYSDNDIHTGLTKIRLVLEEEAPIADILSILKVRNIKVLALSKEEPNLEDVFLYLVGSKLR